MKNEMIKPVLKWVGGKRQLLPEIKKYIPENYTRYYEPFVGGGAVFFDIQPNKAVLNDYNNELINVYKVIKDDVEELIEDLKKHVNEEEYFYMMREMDRTEEYVVLSDVKKASRIIYLNKTCFNGLYRVNSSGFFNTPFGRYKNPNIVNEYTLRAVSDYFNKKDITFKTGDFEDALKGIRKGAFVYFDPPYAPVSATSNYTGYTLAGFNEDDQIRLKKLCDKLDKKGVKFLISNSNVPFIRDLYDCEPYKIKKVDAKRSINAKGDGRGEVEEVLIRNY